MIAASRPPPLGLAESSRALNDAMRLRPSTRIDVGSHVQNLRKYGSPHLVSRLNPPELANSLNRSLFLFAFAKDQLSFVVSR